MKPPFIWDKYSDQPYPLKDKAYKKMMRKKHIWDYIPLFLTNIILFPLSIALMSLFKGKKVAKEGFYGMGVDLDKGEVQKELIEELGVKHLLVRMPLWEMDRIEEYVTFVKSFGEDKHILLNILQDREHIEDETLLVKDINTVFEKFSPLVKEYQIGNAINRTKWGFFSMGEYLKWYQHIQAIRDEKYPDLKLIGSSVIDFEYHYTIRTLFNFCSLKYDKLSSLLYVDRRGSPNNTQMGIFDTKNKISMLYSLAKLSSKTNDDISNLMLALEKMVGHNDMLAYLTMMTIRLIELHRVLKKTGSIYLHCDPTASHYLKIVLDVIFGKKNFKPYFFFEAGVFFKFVGFASNSESR